jgi:starch synthase (maltosyl-transferring)
MNHSITPSQEPAPGIHIVKFCGDIQTFTLSLPTPIEGNAWLRTNIGYADTMRDEIILEVMENKTPLGRDWFDIPMIRIDEQHFQIRLPLCQVGHFEAKCFFLKQHAINPVWPEGPNCAINVGPADTCCQNTIYNAFVRQFGPNKGEGHTHLESDNEHIQTLDQQGYTVIPPSGKFRDLIQELDFIVDKLRCRIIQLLPIHPTPTTYGRMGRFGSPYAALSFTAVDPALAEFDPHATPLEQFMELVDAVHHRNARLFIDIAINHTGWAADLHETHPQWLIRGAEGKIKVPGAWGVRWEDLTQLDYRHKDLWHYMADVFVTWCNRGVDGFRCDAGYMIPVEAWQYIVAKVRKQYPDTVFLLEGLGGKVSVTRDLLNTANLNWFYSELFQNYDRGQIENYLPQAIDISNAEGITVHFAETHDNPRLASRSSAYARMRTALCALLSSHGAFGFANGVEWYATDKINVHNSPSLNWGAEPNQVDHIRRLNLLLESHPAFYGESELKMIQEGGGNTIVLLRYHMPTGKSLLVIVNLDDENSSLATWKASLAGLEAPDCIDLLSDATVTISKQGETCSLQLDPGQVLCLTQEKKDWDHILELADGPFELPRQIEIQRLRAKVFEVFTVYHGTRDIGTFDLDRAVSTLKNDPAAFCRDLNPFSLENRVITWNWPQDLRREVMIPPGHFLMVRADCAFRAHLFNGLQVVACEESLKSKEGFSFALFTPIQPPKSAQSFTLRLSVYSPEGGQHKEASLLVLPKPENVRIKRIFKRTELLGKNFSFLSTNGRGAMLHVPISWGTLNSRYDSLLAANINSEYPEDRWIMFTRCRAWLVFQDYSQELNMHCLEAFGLDDASCGYWCYHVPTGLGEHILMILHLNMKAGDNIMQMTFYRQPLEGVAGRLDDLKPVQLILRPDIENRNFHDTTKAYTGPENQWPQSIMRTQKGFQFVPDPEHHLRIQISEGEFVWEPEWQYMVHRDLDAERGLDPDSDLFSPGYFSIFLKGGQRETLSTEITKTSDSFSVKMSPYTGQMTVPFESEKSTWRKPQEILTDAMDDFVVRRGGLKSVIAGYPWFIDWGRDALIFVRGLIAAGKMEESRAILKQFSQYEQQGTLPNMIQGNQVANRDSADAPLWFIVACDDLMSAEKSNHFLAEDCSGRSILDILLSIGQAIMSGTNNGIKMDPETGLVFSPAHFTWMDTDHPAGTPRQGYPIEIQALWYAAIRLLAKVDRTENQGCWYQLSLKVQTSILKLFWQNNLGYLSDCLHATYGQPAAEATPDDALRPNQLLAITLGAVRDKDICRSILASCEALLVPGAIRSLADRPVDHPIEIAHQEKIINDPHHPYQGKYSGDEDTRRKAAYHNGTAWTWLFPSFCEAWLLAYGDEGRETALSMLSTEVELLNHGCLGHIPEILDGDFPHTPRGCYAQAWGASELLRVWLKLQDEKELKSTSNV